MGGGSEQHPEALVGVRLYFPALAIGSSGPPPARCARGAPQETHIRASHALQDEVHETAGQGGLLEAKGTGRVLAATISGLSAAPKSPEGAAHSKEESHARDKERLLEDGPGEVENCCVLVGGQFPDDRHSSLWLCVDCHQTELVNYYENILTTEFSLHFPCAELLLFRVNLYVF